MTKKLTIFLLATALLFGSAVVFSSCDKDDDEGPGNSDMLIGMWVRSNADVYLKKGGVLINKHSVNEVYNDRWGLTEYSVNFNTDGTVAFPAGNLSISAIIITDEKRGDNVIHYNTFCGKRWIYSGRKLYFSIPEYNDSAFVIMKELTATKMVYSSVKRERREGITYEIEIQETFTKRDN